MNIGQITLAKKLLRELVERLQREHESYDVTSTEPCSYHIREKNRAVGSITVSVEFEPLTLKIEDERLKRQSERQREINKRLEECER